MTAQVFGVRIPSEVASRREGYETGTPGGRQLVIVLQVFDDPLNQASIAQLCRLFAAAGTRLVAVEAADRQLTRATGRTDIANLLRTEMVSAGVLSVLNAGDVPLSVWGTDDMSLIPPSHACMEVVSAGRGARDEAFEELCCLLRLAQYHIYGTPMGWARRARLNLYGERAPVSEQVRRLIAAAGGSPPAGYPLIRRFAEIMAGEQHFRADRAERERKEFYTRVVGRTQGWFRPAGGNRITIDIEKLVPVLQFWLDETGQAADSVMPSLQSGNAEPILLACKQWYDSWITNTALQTAPHEMAEQLMRLALRLDVPYFELRDFREWVAHSRDQESLKVGLDDEIGEAMIDLADRLPHPQAGALRELEDRFELLFLMAQLAVPPREADLRVGSEGALADAVADLERMSGQALPASVDGAIQRLNDTLEAAQRFLDYSRRRSQHMVERTLSLLDERREDRAVLVVGGFHSRAVTRALDDHPDVSWAVVMPAVNVEAAWQQHRERF